MPRRSFGVLGGLCLLGASLVGCAGGSTDDLVQLQIDTLPSGAVHVRNPSEGEWERSGIPPWSLVRELRVGEADGEAPYVFGQIRSVLPAGDGGFWVMDSRFFELRRFDGEGRWVRTVGRRGDGPGEFSGSDCILGGPNGEVWSMDNPTRLQRFDASGDLVDIHRNPGVRGCTSSLTPDGRLLARGGVFGDQTRMQVVEHRLADSGDLVPGADTFFIDLLIPDLVVDNQGNGVFEIPFSPLGAWTHDRIGDFYLRAFDRYRIVRRNLVGDTLLIVEREVQPISIPDAVRDAAIQEFMEWGSRMLERNQQIPEGQFSPERVPDVYPSFDAFWVADDGLIWTARMLESGEEGFDIFSSEGVFLGSIASPMPFSQGRVVAATGEYLFAIVEDDLGIPYIERWRITRGDASQ